MITVIRVAKVFMKYQDCIPSLKHRTFLRMHLLRSLIWTWLWNQQVCGLSLKSAWGCLFRDLQASEQGGPGTGCGQAEACSGPEQGLACFCHKGQTVSIWGLVTTRSRCLGLKVPPADSWMVNRLCHVPSVWAHPSPESFPLSVEERAGVFVLRSRKGSSSWEAGVLWAACVAQSTPSVGDCLPSLSLSYQDGWEDP